MLWIKRNKNVVLNYILDLVGNNKNNKLLEDIQALGK